MGEECANLRWGVERRLEFIEFRLFWEGHVNRADLIDSFGISLAQASTDLNRYLDLAPGNMAYDKSAKTYVREPNFSPKFLQPDAERYLAQLRSISDGILDASDSWIREVPTTGGTPNVARSVSAKTLRAVVAAIRRKEALEINYQSMSSPDPRWRWISPHAIGFDGFRWHARAYCEGTGSFKDFVISRILEVRGTRAASADALADIDWLTDVVLEIGPHPALSPPQKKAIGLDYGMSGGKAEIHVRRALLYYTLKRLGLDTDPAARHPQDQQIVLLNREAIELASGNREEIS